MKKQFLLSVYFRTQGKEQREIILPLQTRMTCASISALFWHVEASTNSLKLLLGHLLPLVKKFIFIKRSNRILFYCNFLNFAVIFLVTLCKLFPVRNTLVICSMLILKKITKSNTCRWSTDPSCYMGQSIQEWIK